MRATVFTLACILLSITLVACQYVEVERTPTPVAEADDTAAEEPTPTPTPEPEPEPTEEPAIVDTEWMERGRLSVLISGSDVAPDRDGARTDAMMVATLDIETGQTILFGVPRNYGDIPLPEDIASVLGIEEYPGMLKWLYEDAQDYPELAPDGGDPGMVALKSVISELLGIPIDYYAMVDMVGFIELIDTVGGVEIEVQEPIIVRLLSPLEGEGWQQFEIMPGEQTLDGREALAYTRHRTGTTDYDRMARQRCLVTAMADQADIQTLLTVFPDLLEVVRENVVTDIPLDMLPDLIPLWDVVDTENIISIGFNPPDYLAGQSSDGHNLPEFERILETVQEALENPDQFRDFEDETRGLEPRHC
jgi:polyisoprenyl-teichoic acid--peptidoglycan teichoic acid transferase